MSPDDRPIETTVSPARRWLRLLAGSVLLGAFITLLATASPPVEVLRHNAEQDIQATALFYMDLDRMQEIEVHLESLKTEPTDEPL